KLTRGKPQGNVLLSFSHDSSFADLTQGTTDFASIVKPNDPDIFIRIPMEDEPEESVLFECSLKELDLEVSTGPAVDFRLKRWWCQYAEAITVPLLSPRHVGKDGFAYPIEHRKPNALLHSQEVD